MTRFTFAALAALSMTLATQAGAAAYIKFDGIDGEAHAHQNDETIVIPGRARAGTDRGFDHDNADRGPDGQNGGDGAGGPGR